MSLTVPRDRAPGPNFDPQPVPQQGAPLDAAAGVAPSLAKVTFPLLAGKKRAGTPITALTAYDYPSARLVDEAGIDLLLVGDSLGMAVLGYDSTLPVTLDEMLHHTRAVRRAVRRALLVADMPFGTYHADETEAVRNATRFVKEAGAEAVKIEGVRPALVRRLVDAEIPVVAHLGLMPQGLNRMGGYKVQARTVDAAEALLADALAMEAAGVALLVLEGVPREVAAQVRERLQVPVIGIGAGPGCDGQILVLPDILTLTFAPAAKFVRRYADVGAVMRGAIERYAEDVRAGSFPSDSESYHLSAAVSAGWDEAVKERER
ncbi:3-methyl-2-oxobutanoate hydroxymethyltransferase [Acidipila sp. EB88]|uniref:3-methyl-2-oxobutanoate hydroxymethyltransferase n=1 Tax=Acidipila sp. EB88 TaxID=2305226 RepID=UPI000F5DF1A2|nr:3-methyl-2-oxobutanoate hydroxymethyltransferase [Acidipila sp. EB88]RRA48101.1 3-methyl-2-oxobutanoate hydroxymethyltransferase [Acidipila sp. EB88]